MARPLTDYTDDELRTLLRQHAEHVVYSYNGIVDEMDRRAANRQARASLVLSVVGLAIAVAAIIVAAVK